MTSFAVDANGSSYFSGASRGGLAVTPGALQPELAGGNCPNLRCRCELVMGFCPARCGFDSTPASCADGYLSKLSTDGTMLLYSTYFGSNADSTFETIGYVTLDSANNVYLLGSNKLATTPGTLNLDTNAVFAKLTLDARSTAVAAVSAANFLGGDLAPRSLVAAFLQSSGSVASKLTVTVTDAAGTDRAAQVLYAGPGQINFEISADTALGAATVKVRSEGAVVALGSIRITSVAPGIFAFSSNGRGVAAALIVRVKGDGAQIYESLARYDETLRQWVAVPVDLGPVTDKVFLVLFGTGFRAVPSLSRVQLSVGSQAAQVLYAGEQPTLIGVDQINALLPRTLIGRGEVDVAATIDGKTANVVRVAIIAVCTCVRPDEM